jgi:phosphatidylglycerol---prolipoprotein diacylglyceryl transferase
MLTYPDINPIALSLGPLKVHWYGVMYLLAFLFVLFGGKYRARSRPQFGWKADEIDDLLLYGVLGVVLGGRIGYILFYGLESFAEDPLRLLRIWEGGMSFHGGLLGVLVAMWLYGRRSKRAFFQVSDFVAPLVPPGLFAGRLANFINAELWGGATSLPIGMQVPCDKAVDLCQRVGSGVDASMSVAVHPSQLYEAALEGLLLFVILWLFSSRQRPRMAVSGLFLLGYGLLRFAVEFVRMPDAHIGYLAGGWLTTGMLLTAPMIFFGLLLLVLAYGNREKRHEAVS